MVDTWNNAGTTFTGIGLSVTDTASAAGSLLMDLQVGGSSKFSVTKAGTTTINRNAAAAPSLGTTPTIYSVGADAAINDFNFVSAGQANRVVFARVNGTVASPTAISANDTVGQINGGGYNGSSYVLNSVRLQFRANENWSGTASGSRLEIVATANTTNSPANVAWFYGGGGLHVGGATNDPGNGAISAQGSIRAAVLTDIPAGGSTATGLTSTSTANFGVFFGSGAPTLSAAKGSLYLRSDGTTTNDRAYINTDGATTWTALTTAA
jgi:hypothetical protein